MAKVRLDELLRQRGLTPTVEKARAHILAGEVWLAQVRLDKPGMLIDSEKSVELRSEKLPFVSRGGEKLEFALTHFSVPVRDRVCMDIGASTGGFTDCLLQRDARAIVAIDVGKGQIDSKLRQDARVTVLDETNARLLTQAALLEKFPLAKEISLVTMDVSFISLEKILAPLSQEFRHVSDWVLLFKPQFEVAKMFVAKGGVVRSQAAVRDALEHFHAFMTGTGFTRRGGPEISPVVGKKSGNVEYLLHYALSKT